MAIPLAIIALSALVAMLLAAYCVRSAIKDKNEHYAWRAAEMFSGILFGALSLLLTGAIL
jgi:hypothetical protein